MLAGGRNSRCNPLDESPFSFLLCVSFLLVTPPPTVFARMTRREAATPKTSRTHNRSTQWPKSCTAMSPTYPRHASTCRCIVLAG